jgi:micrococcal nuclease
MPRTAAAVLPLVCLAIAACSSVGSIPSVQTTPAATPTPDASRLPAGVACDWATVVRVVDGDTVRVLLDGAEEPVRYIGIDTPETVHPTLGVQPFGPEATAYNRLLVQGRFLCLEADVSDRDRYGRLLRYAWLEDGSMVNARLLEAGLARVATFPPDVKYIEDRLLPAQRAAAEAGLGLWGE